MLLDRYLLRLVAGPFFGLLALVLFGLSLERLLRLIRMITNEGAPVIRAFELLFFLIPHYLGQALPIGLFLAVLLGLRRLHDRSELVIFFGGGWSLRRLLVPLLLVSALLMAIQAFLVAWAQPETRYAYRATMWEIRKTGALSNLQPGVFERLNSHIVLRAETVSPDGKALGHFFAVVGEAPGARTFLLAREAQLPDRLAAGDIVIGLTDGQILHEEPGKTPFAVRFNLYPWRIPVDAAKTYGARGQDERELFLSELLRGDGPQVALPPVTPREARAEACFRLAQIASLPLLAWLAVPLALLGRGRAGRPYGIALGVLVLVGYEQLLGFGHSMAAKGHLPVPGIWMPPVLLAGLALVLFRRTFSTHRPRATLALA